MPTAAMPASPIKRWATDRAISCSSRGRRRTWSCSADDPRAYDRRPCPRRPHGGAPARTRGGRADPGGALHRARRPGSLALAGDQDQRRRLSGDVRRPGAGGPLRGRDRRAGGGLGPERRGLQPAPSPTAATTSYAACRICGGSTRSSAETAAVRDPPAPATPADRSARPGSAAHPGRRRRGRAPRCPLPARSRRRRTCPARIDAA